MEKLLWNLVCGFVKLQWETWETIEDMFLSSGLSSFWLYFGYNPSAI